MTRSGGGAPSVPSDEPSAPGSEPRAAERPVQTAERPVRAPTAAELTALMQQPSMLAMLQSIISQAAAQAQEGQAHVASERIAQAECEAEEARKALRQQELELEKIRGHQASLVAERAAQ